MKRQALFLFVLLCLPGGVKAQETAIWYFGTEAGLSFLPDTSTSYPSPLVNSAMNAPEGSAVACDSLGSLLFYTNGEVIYSRKHQPMLNGSNLAGHFSSFQPALITRVPNSRHLFYVFTTDANENDFARGYNYSIVDMNADNGFGAVIVKNNPLSSPGTERLAAVRHINNIDVWIITNDFNSNTFRAWLLTCNGISPTPVVSMAGDRMDADRYMNIGALKVSPDGKLLCQTHFTDIAKNENFFQLFDIDKATGVISHPRKIAFLNTLYMAAEFSPDSKLLYLTKGASSDEIEQFEADLSTVGAIASSRVVLPAIKGLFGLQLAPDGKIYVAKTGAKLTVINFPDSKGPGCQVATDKIDLGIGTSGINLPSAINDYAVKNFSYSIVDSCKGVVQFYGINTLGNNIEWHWDFGDGGSSTEQDPVHVFNGTSSIHQVVLTMTSPGTCGFLTRTQTVLQGGIVVHAGFDYEQDCDSGYVRLINSSYLFPETAGHYLWSFGGRDTTSVLNPVFHYDDDGSGSLVVKLKIITGTPCRDDSVVKVIPIHTLDIKAPRDQSINEGESLSLFAIGGGTHFEWSPVDGLSNPTIANPVATPLKDVSYTVRVTDDYGCSDADTVNIKVFDLDGIYVPNAFTPNNDALNDDIRPILGLNYTLKQFTIYNRWGERIFSTQEKGKGWNGIYKGVVQAGDSYVWMLTVTDLTGTGISRKGTFVLIR